MKIQQIFNKIVFEDTNYSSKLANLSPEQKITLTNLLQKVAEEQGDAIFEKSGVSISFSANGNPNIQIGSLEWAKFKAEAEIKTPIGSASTTASLKGIESDHSLGLQGDSINYESEKSTYMSNKPGGQSYNRYSNEVSMEGIGGSASASGQLFGASYSYVYIRNDGSAIKGEGTIDVGKLEVAVGAGVSGSYSFRDNKSKGFGGEAEVKAEVEAKLAEAKISGSYFFAPNISVNDSNGSGDINVTQKEWGINVSLGLSAKSDLKEGKMSVTKGFGIGIVNEEYDVSDNQFFLFSFKDYEAYTQRLYSEKIKQIDGIINLLKNRQSVEKYQIKNPFQNDDALIKFLGDYKNKLNRIQNVCSEHSSYQRFATKSTYNQNRHEVSKDIIIKANEIAKRPSQLSTNITKSSDGSW